MIWWCSKCCHELLWNTMGCMGQKPEASNICSQALVQAPFDSKSHVLSIHQLTYLCRGAVGRPVGIISSECQAPRRCLIIISWFFREDQRWWWIRGKLHLSPPRTKLLLQLKYRAINLKNPTKSSLKRSHITMNLQRSHVETGRKQRCEKGWPHLHGWWLRSQRDISAARFPIRSIASQPHAELPSTEHQIWEEKPA